MKKWKMVFRRFCLLNKRLLKKPGFLAILLLIPILVGAFTVVTKTGDSGLVTVAIGRMDNGDAIAMEITEHLMTSTSLIHFIDCDTPEKAIAHATSGKADAAWIFYDDLERRIDTFTAVPNKRNAFVKIVEQENNVLLQITHEKLFSAIFPYLSYAKYEDFIAANVVELTVLPKEKLREYYDSYVAEGENLFEIFNIDSDIEETEDAHYLLAPIRGLLSIMILIGGFAVAMYYMQDQKEGRFDFMKIGKRAVFSLYYHFTAVLDIAVVAILTMYVAGIGLPIGREILTMALYALMIVGFTMMLSLACGKIGIFGAFIPVVSMMTISLCPIFFDTIRVPLIQFLLPTYYYLHAVYDNRYLWYMAIYSLVTFAVSGILYKIREK